MKYKFDSNNWNSIEQGEKNCFLLTNGLGGFTSLTHIGSVARGDQSLLMAAKKAPNVRWNIITNVYEEVCINEKSYILTSQRMVDESKNLNGFNYLISFEFDIFPKWTYRFEDVIITKTITMVHGENTVAILYDIKNPNEKKVKISVTPLLRDTPKNDSFSMDKIHSVEYMDNAFKINETNIYVVSNGRLFRQEEKETDSFYFSQDERDGRNSKGTSVAGPEYRFSSPDEEEIFEILFSIEPKYNNAKVLISDLFKAERNRVNEIEAKALLKSDLANTLLRASDAYLVNRDSINGKSIIAGYPFFEDWGRDTMISLPGICLTTKRFKECKQILQTFAKYEKDGLLPNLFPEGDIEPMYNSVDAPLLFINTVYEYVIASGDDAFIDEVYPVLEEIIENYKKGTHYHIGMDLDYLIKAGADLEQLTWMDVRVNGFLPTPRHGKPVEINAYWYSALKVMEMFSKGTAKKKEYEDLAKKVKESFLTKFWNEKDGCLKDVLSDDYQENQIRPNQIWALTMPFIMLTTEMEKQVIEKVKTELFTYVGLRTLSTRDKDFHPVYIGGMEERDRAYHQGTVWTFPLGAFYRACIKYSQKTNVSNEKEEMIRLVKEGLKQLDFWLEEGCVNQLAEIYDGLTPTVSRGCFAQAWSVGELLRAVDDYDKLVVL